MKERIVDNLSKQIIGNCGRWCSIVLKATGEEVTIIRTGYGPMERPAWDSHEIMIDGTVVKECDNLYEVADWILERSV